MQKSPPPFIWAVPEEKNILDCECGVGSKEERHANASAGHFIIVRCSTK
jgi:hypothetical protein